MGHHVILLRCGNSVAFGAKRTLASGLQSGFYAVSDPSGPLDHQSKDREGSRPRDPPRRIALPMTPGTGRLRLRMCRVEGSLPFCVSPGIQRMYYSVFVFDGAGKLTGKQSSSRGGKIGREKLEGSYTLDADCA